MSPVEIVSAVLPGGPGPGQDRCVTADGLVIILDGASAFDPTANPDASRYVDTLAQHLVSVYAAWPDVSLADGLAWAIRTTTESLDLTAGSGPSSTVSAIRWTAGYVEVLSLGDSPILVRTRSGCDHITDNALRAIAPELRSRYQDALAGGYGFSDEHRAVLSTLQRHQAEARNRLGGYWVAEADPDAAQHAHVRTYEPSDVLWCAAVTDGAQHPAEHLGHDWDSLVKLDGQALFDLLVELHHWETTKDPDGQQLPRAKRHDDKTIAVIRPET